MFLDGKSEARSSGDTEGIPNPQHTPSNNSEDSDEIAKSKLMGHCWMHVAQHHKKKKLDGKNKSCNKAKCTMNHSSGEWPEQQLELMKEQLNAIKEGSEKKHKIIWPAFDF